MNLFFAPPTPSQGNLLPVYRRADLSRAIVLVVTLLLAAPSTSACAREFRAADTGMAFGDSSARSICDSFRPVRAIADLNSLRPSRDRTDDRTNPQGGLN
ncbi:hypothetical protein [Bradyrhizobium sp.]|uniref:hypothetical protein n=1 Tax=Bradyrhizobium sp. TaxID=376 RepID=UPI003C7178FF